MTRIAGTDPRTGQTLDPVVEESDTAVVDATVRSAAAAAAAFAELTRDQRAALLDSCADEIEERSRGLADAASTETGFTDAKLTAELRRTAFQFRFFAGVLREGSYLEATIDHAAETPMGPQPDLRRLLVPVGPVAVFGASNFPFAFSVLGGDTVSALAAGNPVVVKAHSSHPQTSLLSFALLREVLGRTEAPDAAVGIVYGHQAGLDLVRHPAVRAVGFTGSLRGGRALLAAIDERREPIPFYGELSSLNPIVVTPAAAADRARDIGAGFATSLSTGAGQLCTKGGFLLVPEGDDGDALVDAVADSLRDSDGHVLLNSGVHATFVARTGDFARRRDVRTVVGRPSGGPGFAVGAAVFEVSLDDLDDDLVDEVFGPVAVVVRYDPARLVEATAQVLGSFPDSLTATLHVGDEDEGRVRDLARLATQHAGRVVFDGFPTGVAVAWAQTHGGPWPATNSTHTSVGATSIRRFLRPVTYQNAPAHVLPPELVDGFDGIPRRLDGVLVAARVTG